MHHRRSAACAGVVFALILMAVAGVPLARAQSTDAAVAQTVHGAPPDPNAIPPGQPTDETPLAPNLPPGPSRVRLLPNGPKHIHAPQDNHPITRTRDGVITVEPIPTALVPRIQSQQPGRDPAFTPATTSLQPSLLNFGSLSLIGSPQSSPWSRAVKIFTYYPSSGWWQCSGSMVDASHVMTAGHCVYDDVYREWGTDFRVYPAATAPDSSWSNATIPFGSGGSWYQAHSFTGWTDSADFDYDLGMIDITRPVGALSGWYGYGYNDSCSFYQSNTFRTAGYPGQPYPYDGSKMYGRYGTFDSCDTLLGVWYGNEIRFNAESYHGQSGSGQVLDSGNILYAILSNGDGTYTDSPRITSGEFSSISGWIGEDTPSSVDVVAMWTRGSSSVAAGAQLGSMTYYIYNNSSLSVAQTYSVSVYLSTNNIISTADRLLQTHSVSINALPRQSTIVTVTVPPTIPSDVAPGSYYLGVILNTTDANTGNNASSGEDALPLTVTPPQTPTVTVTANDPTAAEPSNTGQFTITRSGSTSSSLPVNFTLTGTATNGIDYAGITSPVTIPAGSSSTTVTIWPVDDTLVEPTETAILNLQPGSGYLVGSPSTATVSIADNDVPCFTLTAYGNPANGGYPAVNTAANCNNGSGYTAGTAISVTAVPFSGYQFTSWSATNCSLANAFATTTTCTVTGSGNPSVTANFVFAPSCFTLTALGNPANGGYPAINTAANCNNGGGYTAGTAIGVTAVPFTGYQFTSWSAVNCSLANANAITTSCVVSGGGPVTVTANFSPLACTGFSINPAGANPGAAAGSINVTVTGSPAGCTSSWSASVNASWLSASPLSGNGSGSVVVSWQRNPSPTPRAGSVTIAGNTFSVTQSGGRRAHGDFTGDGKTDAAVYRPSTGTWYVSGGQTIVWGIPGDIPVAGDYDGDGRTDIAVYRPSNGVWYIVPSSGSPIINFTWGGGAFQPAPGDYDGDGKTDIAVYLPSSGLWYIVQSSNGATRIVTCGGASRDIPLPADYDGDGKDDPAVENPTTGLWTILQSSNGAYRTVQWGGSGGDLPVPYDFDGDGKADIAIESQLDGKWYIIQSSNGATRIVQWGGSGGDQPQPGDYDGDGVADICVFNAGAGKWYVIKSSNGGTVIVTLGQSGDLGVSR